VLGIYVVASWVALQVVDLLVDNFGLPSWFPAFALALLVLLLPVVLATAFVQEGGPGQEREPGVAGKASPDPASPPAPEIAAPRFLTWRTSGSLAVGALAIWGLVAAVWIARGWTPDPEGVANPALAVLPFDNLGSADARYFADGVHEDVLTQLSKIASLDVISRTSVMAYRDAQRNVRDIARELGVGAVVEGSVRHDPLGNRVRVVVQLIDAQTDRHLWAEQYDRDLDDVFAIQNELALSIARALSATLTPDEERRIAQRPVPNTAAYDLILRGRELYGQNLDANTMAMELFRQATVADRTSAEAWAELGPGAGPRAGPGPQGPGIGVGSDGEMGRSRAGLPARP
jgi:TolB-like protein